MSSPVICVDPEILGGTPVFQGTRVPIDALFDYLKAGEDLDEFLDDYPGVSKEQALELLELASKSVKDIDEAAA